MWAFRGKKEEMGDGQVETKNCCASMMHEMKVSWEGTKDEYVQFFDELKDECTPSIRPAGYYKELVQDTMRTWFHIPYFPAFHRPGWLLRYLLGPFDSEWIALFVAGDFLLLFFNRYDATHLIPTSFFRVPSQIFVQA